MMVLSLSKSQGWKEREQKIRRLGGSEERGNTDCYRSTDIRQRRETTTNVSPAKSETRPTNGGLPGRGLGGIKTAGIRMDEPGRFWECSKCRGGSLGQSRREKGGGRSSHCTPLGGARCVLIPSDTVWQGEVLLLAVT